MKPKQLQLDLGTLSSQQFEPVPVARQGAEDFMKARGHAYKAPHPQLQQDPLVGYAVGKEYQDNAARGDVPPRLVRSYGMMRDEVNAQHDFMTRPKERGGLGVKHEIAEDDPYQTPQDMAEDVRTNNRIRTYPTASTGPHAYFSDEENDKFRAVHDFFGHAAIGRGFSRHGEEAAFRSHLQMFPPAAREAVTSETRGQNSHLNYSPKGGFPDNGMVPMSKLAQDPNASKKIRRKDRGRSKP